MPQRKDTEKDKSTFLPGVLFQRVAVSKGCTLMENLPLRKDFKGSHEKSLFQRQKCEFSLRPSVRGMFLNQGAKGHRGRSCR